ncbi:hypothetical protein [Actinomycetospora sp. NBRC 106378]|uniref:hypothetical protein n=1 Tax=Actinomycetospora sp. NBRC 106378 TaxID=3032208 RepID=UPI0024A429E7|nr:hypothetical protein [Actinomycetospora sp. NBRC 106378]GLZ51621.1 hypothetical protein Acsp07_12380 [Actinomycetospora sp. NBRC 106378]
MAAHSAPSSPRQRRTTALTAIATALAVVGLMVLGSTLTSPSPGREPGALGTTAGPVALLDAPAVAGPAPSAARTSAPRTTTRPTTTTSAPTRTKAPRTTTTTADSEE